MYLYAYLIPIISSASSRVHGVAQKKTNYPNCNKGWINTLQRGVLDFNPPLSHAFFHSLSFSLPSFNPPDHGLSFSLFHIATRAFCQWRRESHNSGRKSSLWFLARHIRPHAHAIPLQLYVGKPSMSFLGSLGKRSNDVLLSFGPCERQVADTLAFWLFASSLHNRPRLLHAIAWNK